MVDKVRDYRRRKLADLIQEVSDLNGGDDPAFLAEYIADVTNEWSNRLIEAIACFERLKKQPASVTKISAEVVEVEYTGHGAFRVYYEQLAKTKAGE